MWSGPRNVSTALMYAFSQRPDTTCLDEPLYGHYLRVSGADHPAAREVMNAMECDGAKVVSAQLLGPSKTPVLFCKQMAHHLRDLELDFLDRVSNAVLIRDPREVLPTLSVQVPQPTLADTGYQNQLALLERFGSSLPVVDAQQLLLNPPAVLEQLCERLGLSFDDSMLNWPAGAKVFDGVWAPHWYHNVHRSTGFAPYRVKTEPLPEYLQGLLEQCEPLYQQLRECAINA